MARTWPGPGRRAFGRPRLTSIPAPHSCRAPPAKEVKRVTIDGESFKVSKVFRIFFWFICERQRMFQRRLAGESPPWTDDKTLTAHPYINVFRVFDRNTQYIITSVIGKRKLELKDAFFRVLLFCMFNRIETWEYLERKRGSLMWDDFDVEEYADLLSAVEGPLYSGAYIIPAPTKVFGFRANYENHLRLIDLMMSLQVYDELKRMDHLKDAHGYICLFPSMGEFTSMQLILDLNLLPHYDWNEDEWVALGPGSTACLHKMFGKSIAGREQDAMRHIRDHQMEYFERFGLTHGQLPQMCPERGPGLTLVDIEHALCECEKYSRAVRREIIGRRQSAGRPYNPKTTPVTDHIPEKWRRPLQMVCWQQPAGLDGEDTYEVSHIVREVRECTYLVRWTGRSPERDDVLSESDLEEGAAEVVAKWKRWKAEIDQGIRLRRK